MTPERFVSSLHVQVNSDAGRVILVVGLGQFYDIRLLLAEART